MDRFDANIEAMTASIQQNKTYSRKVKALLTPDREVEYPTHQEASSKGVSCPCRVCYWAKGR